MKIQPQLFIMPKQNGSIQLNRDNKNKNQTTENRTYNPIYYSDFNITFGARLNRTPANFYAQPFNKAGMPKSMKDYLIDDYEDRQNVPPAQMMKIVFEPINYADNLEEVKELFPDEPLFQNLTDKPNRKSRTGVLAEIELMRDENTSLFKNGKNDLGMYLLKKIYLEGKSLKEINTDFSKDISSAYKGLSPIDYDTFSAYGIKMPNRGFWKSFLATRDDFPYEYKPRKAFEHSGINRDGTSEKDRFTPPDMVKEPRKKGKFDDVKDYEYDRLAKAYIDGKGNPKETQKALKKTSVQNKESLTFAAQYWSPIMLITLDRIHASDEMKDFFINYESLNKSQKKKMDDYWASTLTRRYLQSIIIKDTIKLFMELYGADGNNDEFRDLINYAEQIPQQRKLRKAEHDKIQKEYEEMFAALDMQKESETKPEETESASVTQAESSEDINNNPFIIFNGPSIAMSEKLRKEYNFFMNRETEILPPVIRNKYLNFLNIHPLATDEYKIIRMFGDNDLFRQLKPDIMKKEEADKITKKIGDEFAQKNPVLMNNYIEALADTCYEYGIDTAYLMYWYHDDINKILEFFNYNYLKRVLKGDTEKFKQDINEKFNSYQKPLTNHERIGITHSFIKAVNNIDTNTNETLQNNSKAKYLIRLLQRIFADKPDMKKTYKDLLYRNNIFNDWGGNTRVFLDRNLPRQFYDEKVIAMITGNNILSNCTYAAALSDLKLINEVVGSEDPEVYDKFLKIFRNIFL